MGGGEYGIGRNEINRFTKKSREKEDCEEKSSNQNTETEGIFDGIVSMEGHLIRARRDTKRVI